MKPNEIFDPRSELKYELCNQHGLSNVTNNVVSFNLLWTQESLLSQKYPMIKTVNFWIHAIVLRTLPCVFLLILSLMLIYAMSIANKNRLKLIQQGRKKEYEKAGEFNRTTTMLLIVCISFLIMELPVCQKGLLPQFLIKNLQAFCFILIQARDFIHNLCLKRRVLSKCLRSARRFT